MTQQIIVIDACCLLNLLATLREVEITQALAVSWVIPESARAEVNHLRTPPDEAGERHRVVVDLVPLERAGLLETRALDDEWLDAFVTCAAHLNDADAACVALAATMDVPLATDDPRERRVAKELYDSLQIKSTLEFLQRAANVLELDDSTLAQIAYDLRWRGNFLPPRRDPLGSWFARHLAQGVLPVGVREDLLRAE